MVKIGVDDKATNKITEIAGNVKTGLSNAAKAGAQAFAAATAAVVAGTATIGKAALEAYADYEQLAGGVKKLYGEEAYSQMMEYAQNAYMTVGVTANQYMQSVTAFSAAMLNSVGGDADKAAALADQAMQDIADNANTFGVYTVDELTGVYQALAKGMYNTLDNLNLGFAGTKEGMQQLIDKANELKEANGEMGDLSIDSFADITEAIHLVQEDMNIAGTTAKEAATTITGSLNMTKAAWGNLLIELGKDDGNVGERLKDLVNSATTFLMGAVDENGERISSGVIGRFQTIVQNLADVMPELVPTIAEAAGAMFGALIQSLAVIGPQLASSLFDVLLSTIATLRSAIPSFKEGASSMFSTLVDAVKQAWPIAVANMSNLLVDIISSIREILPEMLSAAGELFYAIMKALLDNAPEILNGLMQMLVDVVAYVFDHVPDMAAAALDLFFSLVKAVHSALEPLMRAIGDMLWGAVNAIQQAWSDFFNAGVSTVMGIVGGIGSKIGQVASDVGKGISDAVDAVGSFVGEMWSAGWNVVQGIIDGIWSNIGNVASTILSGFRGAVDTVKSFLGIASPSKLFAEIGKNTMLGMVEGIEDNMDKAENAMRSAAEDIYGAASGTVSIGASTGILGASNGLYGVPGVNIYGDITIMADNPDEFMDWLTATARQARRQYA